MTTLADPYVQAAFRQPGDWDERGKYARLAEVVKNIVGENRWRRDPSTETIKVLRRAIAALPDKFSGRSPDKSQLTNADNAWKGLPEREFAELMYGFRDEEILRSRNVSPGDLGYDTKLTYRADYRDEIIQRANQRGVNERSAKRTLTIIWQDLTQILLDMEAEAIRQAAAADSRTDKANYNVDRPELLQQLREALGWGEPLTWVHGPPGSGKTKSVEAMLRILGENASWIDCSDRETMHDQIGAFLHSRKIVPVANSGALRSQLIEHLASAAAPSHVVFDNYENHGDGKSPFPELSESHQYSHHVVVISRYPASLSMHASRVHIENLTASEADELIQHYLPDSQSGDRKDLAAELYYRVLLLNQACKTISEYDEETIQGYLQSIAAPDDRQQYVFDVADEVDRTISGHYQYLISRLQNPRSLQLLDILAGLRPGVSLSTIQILWSEIFPDGAVAEQRPGWMPSKSALEHGTAIGATLYAQVPDSKISANQRASIKRAVDILARLGIIEATADKLSMHTLTKDMCKMLRAEEYQAANRRLILGLTSRAHKWEWRSREVLPVEIFHLVEALPLAIGDALVDQTTHNDPVYIDALQFAMALRARASRQQLSRTDTLMRINSAFHIDNRKLLMLTGKMLGNPSPVDEISQDVIAAHPSTKIGISTLLDEYTIRIGIADLVGVAEWQEFYSEQYRQLGITRPSMSVRAVKELALDFGIHYYTNENEWNQLQISLVRQSGEETIASRFHQRDDQLALLTLGRLQCSIGMVDNAIAILLTNARKVTLIGGSVDSIWIAIESLRVCSDVLLRKGQLQRAIRFSFELRSIIEKRSIDVGLSSFALYDLPLQLRKNMLEREIIMCCAFDENEARIGFERTLAAWDSGQEPGSPPSSIEEYRIRSVLDVTHEALRDWQNFSGPHEREVRYELFEQVNRFAVIAGIVVGSDFEIEINREKVLETIDYLAKGGDVEHSFIITYAGRIKLAYDQCINPGTQEVPIANLGDLRASRESGVEAKDGKVDYASAVTGLAELARIIHSELGADWYPYMHWYEKTRQRVFAACVAMLSDDMDVRELVVDLGKEAARQAEREDWVALIDAVRDDPKKLVLLLVR